MPQRMTRSLVLAAALTTLLFAALLSSASAFAIPGDSPSSATWLPIGSSLTTSLVDPGDSTGEYYFKVQLNAGNTLRADFIGSPEAVNLKADVIPFAKGYLVVESDKLSATQSRLTFMAPVTGVYTITAQAAAVGTFTVQAAKVGAVRYGMTGFSAPSKQKKNKAFTLAVKLLPDYDSPRSPIAFIIQHKVGKKFKSYRTVAAKFGGGNAAYTRFFATSKLPRGTFRVRVRFTDAAHPKAAYTGYRAISVK